MSASTIDTTIDRGLDWLVAHQAESGELPTYAGPIEGDAIDWSPDSLIFITALVALACAEVDDPRCSSIIDRAVTFIRAEREPGPLWRYWTKANPQHDFTPPDTDVVACCSMVVALRGDDTSANIPLLMASRDPAGRFYTWMLPRRTSRSARYLWTIRDEFRRSTRERRRALFTETEAEPDNVDGGVNVNLLRYLGPSHSPDAVISWIREILRAEREDDCDSWYRNRFTIYAFVADAFRRGITGFGDLAPTIVGRIVERTGAGGLATDLDAALALLTLQAFDGPREERSRLCDALVARQGDEGAWARSVFYHGGPKELFGWGSEALVTAFAVQALAAER